MASRLTQARRITRSRPTPSKAMGLAACTLPWGASYNSVDYCTIEYNKWGIFDTGSNDSYNGNTVTNNNTNWVVS